MKKTTKRNIATLGMTTLAVTMPVAAVVSCGSEDDSKVKELKNQIDAQQKELDAKNKAIADKQAEIKNEKSRADAKQKEIDEIKAKLVSKGTPVSNKGQLNADLEAKKAELAKIKAEIKNTAADLEKLKDEAKAKNKTIQDKDAEIATLKNDKKALETKLSTAVQERDDLKAEVKTKDTQLQSRQTEIDKLTKQITDKDAEIKTKQGEIDTLTADAATNTTKIADLEKSVNNKTTEIASLKATAATNTTKIADLEKSVNDKKLELDKLKADAATNATKIANLEKSVNDKKLELDKLKTDATGNATKIANLENDIKTKQGEIDTLTADAATNATKIADLEKSVNNKTTEIASLKATAATNATKIADLEKQAKTDSDEIAKLNADITAKDTEIKTKEQEIGTLTTEKQGLNGQLTTVTKERDTLKADLKTKTDELQTKTTEVATLNKTVTDKDAEIKTKQDEIDKLKAEVADKDKDIAGLEKDITKLVPKGEVKDSSIKEDLTGATTFTHFGDGTNNDPKFEYVGTKNGLFKLDPTTHTLTKVAGYDSVGDMTNGFIHEFKTKQYGRVVFIGTKNGLWAKTENKLLQHVEKGDFSKANMTYDGWSNNPVILLNGQMLDVTLMSGSGIWEIGTTSKLKNLPKNITQSILVRVVGDEKIFYIADDGIYEAFYHYGQWHNNLISKEHGQFIHAVVDKDGKGKVYVGLDDGLAILENHDDVLGSSKLKRIGRKTDLTGASMAHDDNNVYVSTKDGLKRLQFDNLWLALVKGNSDDTTDHRKDALINGANGVLLGDANGAKVIKPSQGLKPFTSAASNIYIK
ncbi:hypothetical protein [Mycoplasma todarodis]|uniref:hypothetical protein n=1 Tax=Mycoplasma todarodis TaxID=1937191 RepID=UPI003B50ADC6